MNLAVGQVPVQPLVMTVVDDNGRPVDLSAYDTFEVALVDPNGASVDTSAGVTQLVDGKVKYLWPPATLFPTAGDYSLRLGAFKGAAVDWTERTIIEVYGEDI